MSRGPTAKPRRAGCDFPEQLLIECAELGNDLQIVVGRAVVEGNKLIIAKAPHPPHYDDFLVFRHRGQQLSYFDSCIEHDFLSNF